jgi:hypothetical protein
LGGIQQNPSNSEIVVAVRLRRPSANISNLVWTGEGQLLAGSSTSAEISIWNSRSVTVITYPWNTVGQPGGAAFLPTIKLWDLDTRGEVVSLRSFNLAIVTILSSPDGQSTSELL